MCFMAHFKGNKKDFQNTTEPSVLSDLTGSHFPSLMQMSRHIISISEVQLLFYI